MKREYHRWFSPSLGRDMEMLIFGHGGARVLVFPTSQGRYYEWEDRGMMHHFGEQIDRGWFQFFCVDSVDAESWYATRKHPGARAWRQSQYDAYLTNEVLPLTRAVNHNPFLITTGASLIPASASSVATRRGRSRSRRSVEKPAAASVEASTAPISAAVRQSQPSR